MSAQEILAVMDEMFRALPPIPSNLTATEYMLRFDERERYCARLRAAVAALIAERDALREALKEVEDCAEYWSEYFVPVGLPGRIREALATGESA